MTALMIAGKEIILEEIAEYKIIQEYVVYGLEEKVISSTYVGDPEASFWQKLKHSIFSTQDYIFEKEKSYFFDGYYGQAPKYVRDGDWKYDAVSFAVPCLLIKTKAGALIKFHDLSPVDLNQDQIRQANPEQSTDVSALLRQLEVALAIKKPS